MLKVSNYDRAAGMLVATLILLASTVAVMFLAFALSDPLLRQNLTTVEYSGSDAHLNTSSFEKDLELPAAEEAFVLVAVPSVPSLQALVEATSTVVSGESLDFAAKRGSIKDNRPPGPDKDDSGDVPRWERWGICYETHSLAAYARQLDYFQIELGIVGGKPLIEYAKNFGDGTPEVRQGAGHDEKRLYMSWRSGTLRQFDQTLLQQAGMLTTNRYILQFYPRGIEDQLAQLEMEYARRAGHPNVKEIFRTNFEVVAREGGFEFRVLEQRYRANPG